MRPVSWCVALLAAIVTGGFPPQKPAEAKSDQTPLVAYADPEAYRVYAAALAIDGWYWEGSNTILIQKEIPPREWALGAPAQVLRGDAAFGREMEPVFKSFGEANREPRVLNEEMDLHRQHRFVGSAELDEAFRKGQQEKMHDAWQGFREAFPNSAGYLVLSAVGFNPAKTLALVYVEHRCGNRCGAANYYAMQKLGDVWVKYFPHEQ